jgi:hypothetical protein
MYISNITTVNDTFQEYSPIGSDAIFASLTATNSINAYNTASVNNWVQVTGGEYAKVQSLIGTTTYGMTNTQFTTTQTGTTFNATYSVMLSSNSSTALPTGTYLIGFAVRSGVTNTAVVAFPFVGTAYLSGTYTSVGSASYITPASISNTYFVRKAPNSSLPAPSYIGYGNYPTSASYSYLVTGATTWPNMGGYSTTTFNTDHTAASASTPFTSYSSNLPYFQILGTTTKQW